MQIDGSTLEGGGQVIRQSTALAAILRRPICVLHIRAGRDRPGLAAQHLTGINLVADLSGGQLAGNRLRSSEIKFVPGAVRAGEFRANIPSAGSLTLLMQVSLPPLVFAPGESLVRMQGGTNATMAPQIDYLQHVFLPSAARLGVVAAASIVKRGFYPRGGGEVELRVTPQAALRAITALDRGVVVAVHVLAFTAGAVPRAVGPRMAAAAKKLFAWYFNGTDRPALVEQTEDVSHCAAAVGDGTAIMCVARTSTGEVLAGSAIGEKGVAAEEVGRLAAQDLVNQCEAFGCVDEYLQDQLIVFMALAEGHSAVRAGPLSLHTQTAIHFAALMTGAAFRIEEEPAPQDARKMTYIIHCDGIGHRNPNAAVAAAAAAAVV